MYKVQNFHKYACDSTSNNFFGCGHRGDLDVWQIPFKQSIYEFFEISHAKLSCDDFFIFCYWFCIVFALIGFFEALFEFIRVYSDQTYDPTTFWNRTYQHIPLEFQRKARVTGSVVNIITSFCLVYGFTNFRDIYVLPWVITSTSVIGLEMIYWIVAGFSSKHFKLNPLMSLSFLALRLAIAVHVMLVIKKSLV